MPPANCTRTKREDRTEMEKNRKIASALALLVAGLGGIIVVRLALDDPKDLSGEKLVAEAGIPQRGRQLSPVRAPLDGKMTGRPSMEGTSMTMDERHIVVFQNGQVYVLDRQTLMPISHRDLSVPSAPAPPEANADTELSLAPEAVALEQPYTE